MKTERIVTLALYIALACTACKKNVAGSDAPQAEVEALVSLEDVARLLSQSELGREQLAEVYDAVSSSSGNGYDEEYTMKQLFESPGSGVGEEKLQTKAEVKEYSKPLRTFFEEYYSKRTKAGAISAQEYLDYISSSGMQIYWPYSEDWDGEQFPVITFEPIGESSSNIGYCLDDEGEVEEIIVDEQLARSRPVWVINNNSDAGYTSLEVYRRNNPQYEGGDIVIGKSSSAVASTRADTTTSGSSLVLESFCASRNYDCWFAGGSEFFIKAGAVESFTAKYEEDLLLYNPSITDFLVLMKRSEVNKIKDVNTILVSDWTSQLDNIAFLVSEDDGGEVSQWKCSATVKIKSKTYGFEMELPINSRDDIVWRGQLSRKFLEANNGKAGVFGDVSLTFRLKEW